MAETEELLARIERLEKLLLGTHVERLEKPLLGQGEVAKEVKANQFTLVDENGVERATLKAHEKMTGLGLKNQDGDNCLVLMAYDDRGVVNLGRVILTAGETVGLTLLDENEKVRVMFAFGDEEDMGFLSMSEKNGGTRDLLTANGLSLCDENEPLAGLP